MQNLIEATDLEKWYGPVPAVNGITFSVPKGSCVGCLGPNGAGKTTTMRMIYGLTKPTRGLLKIFNLSPDHSPREIKRRMGVVPQENSLDPELTVSQNLEIYGKYFGIPRPKARERAMELIRFFHLEEKIHEEMDHLSGGMKRRLLVARALINQPELLILDEPTTGLDPQSRHLMWDRIQTLKGQGVTFLMTTHYMEEAAKLCDRILVMDHGKIIEGGTPTDLIAKHRVGNLEEVFLKLTGRDLRD